MPDSHASVAVSAAPPPPQTSASSARRESKPHHRPTNTTTPALPNSRPPPPPRAQSKHPPPPRDKSGKYRAPSTTATSHIAMNGNHPDTNLHDNSLKSVNTPLSGGLDAYREGCLKLEKVRHARVYDAERKLLFCEASVWDMFQRGAAMVLEDFWRARRLLCVKMVAENMDREKGVEELRYGFVRDDATGGGGSGGLGWNRRHEMSLRGRAGAADTSAAEAATWGASKNGAGPVRSLLEEDGILAELEREREKERERNGGGKRRRGGADKQKVKLHLQVDEAEALSDLAEIRGEKRPREEAHAPSGERKSKRRK